MHWKQKLLAVLCAVALSAGSLQAQHNEERTVETANEVLREIMAIPAKCIPASLLADAQGVLIIPDMVKGSFIVGVSRGKGVVVMRNEAGEWVAPVFITVTGGSVGAQIGLQATDVIAVFRRREGVDKLMRRKFTIGADAAVAAGPIGREASAATDAQLKAEILSYSRSRGLFAGVAIDGTSIQVDHGATTAYYAPKPGQPVGAVPVSAVRLVEQIASYAGPKHKILVNIKEAPSVPPPGEDIESVRGHLIESSIRLQKVLDPQWKAYLALPTELYAEGKVCSREAMARCLEHYDVVTKNGQYVGLSGRPEFREAHALLIRYDVALAGSKMATLKLPPPPPHN